MFDESFDQEKSEWSKKTRGVDFIDAREVWNDPNSIEGPGTMKDGEIRWLRIGQIKGKIWTVGFTQRAGGIRIFTIRPARKSEKEVYYGY